MQKGRNLHFSGSLWLIWLCGCLLLLGCRQQTESKPEVSEPSEPLISLKYAKGFSAYRHQAGYVVIDVHAPWPGATRDFRYALVPRDASGAELPEDHGYDAVVQVPVRRLVLTSTTHIPALEALGSDTVLVGFPGLDYISSERTRERIQGGQVEELGANDQINTERVIQLQPELVIGFGVTEAPRSYQGILKAGIPVMYNGDWTEASPLGKAEWIKVFGLLLGKEMEAQEYFSRVATAYTEARELAAGAENRPKVLSGALYRDVWYAPGGGSWAASFIRDAGAEYLWADNEATGSLSLGLETVLEKAADADVWIAPSQFRSFSEMQQANAHYSRIRAFRERRVYTYANSLGASGGMLYFEQGPSRPDLVLQDLIYHIHPGLLQGYQPTFFKPLEP